jgi:hypothetical protein
MCKGLRARFAEGAANHSSRPALSPLRIALRPLEAKLAGLMITEVTARD